MKPYYETHNGEIRIYHGKWEDGINAGVFDPKNIAIVHADAPYGINLQTRGRGAGRKVGKGTAPMKERSWPAIAGDERPFNPAFLLALHRPMVLWGANHYASRLPDSPSWLFWDKRDGDTPDNGADGELAWTNLGGPLRSFHHLWKGTCRASEAATAHLHPTQKPEALCAWVFAHAAARGKLRRGDTILVPYMGSGPELRPALAMGCRVIAFDVEERYCRDAVSARLTAVARAEPAETLGPLFSSRS